MANGRRRSRAQSRRGMVGSGTRHDLSAMCESLRHELRAVIEVADVEIAAIESDRDLNVGRLESALAALDGVSLPSLRQDEPPGTPKASRKRERRARRPSSTTPDAVNKRREAVHEYLVELRRPAALSEIGAALNLTPHTVSTALRLLEEEGKVRRVGTGRGTRYEAAGVAPVAQETTLQGKIVATVDERGWVSVDELVQVTGAPADVIERECGTLIVEEVIRRDRRDGRPVYVRVNRG